MHLYEFGKKKKGKGGAAITGKSRNSASVINVSSFPGGKRGKKKKETGRC